MTNRFGALLARMVSALRRLGRLLAPYRDLGIGAAIAIGLLAAGVFVYASVSSRDDNLDQLWSTRVVDKLLFGLLVACIALAVAYAIGLFTPLRQRAQWESFWRPAWGLLGGLVLLAGVYVSYAALRNQARLSAEVALNQEGQDLLSYEMDDSSKLRCVYDNYIVEDHQKCLRNLTSSDRLWSKAVFYVEESWFVIEKSVRDRKSWGSQYASEIRYWADDIAKDPTGLFGYYMIANTGSVCEARNRVIRSEVCIPDLCASYDNVAKALVARRRPPNHTYCTTAVERSLGKLRCDTNSRPIGGQERSCFTPER